MLLFGLPADKDEQGSGAYDDEGVVQLAVRAIKEAHPELVVITDVCLCGYTSHGHCGVVMEDGSVDNDLTLELLAKTAISHARAGADAVAPSDMMDGRVGALRSQLDAEGHKDLPIVAYSAKFASAYYGPFREAADSAPAFGDRRSYQMDPANSDEAVREALLDVGEGADVVMVKPALAYLDVIRRVKEATNVPVAAYNVSGEYAMVKAAAAAGHVDEEAIVLETLTAIRRAGADVVDHLPREGRRPVAQPLAKVRSRKDGAAVPLDELDKKLLNLLQGSFPLEPRPFAHVAGLAGLGEDEVLARTQRLLDERIIREVTPIFDTRVLGYSSMLVAAKVDAENPWRAAKIINSHPGVSHNYLRDHDFNLWFTIATEPGSQLGLDGTLEVLQRLTGAQSVRQLPTLRLFKIRMDLEMEKGTDALAAAAEAIEHREPEAIPLSDDDVATIRADPGPDGGHTGALRAPPPTELGISQDELLGRLESMRERRALRRVAAILFHRRAGFSANGMGVWNVPEERILELGPRMSSFRGISHCYQRPTYADWPYSVFTMAHGRSKEECDAILDSIAADTGIEDRRTLYSSTEFKKIRLRYFTDEHRRWEAEHA